MATDHRSSREIEREIDQERNELRQTMDELLGRLTFEDAWTRVGAHLRDHRSAYGVSLSRLLREKPVGVALTAIGIGWLVFGPSSAPPRRSRADATFERHRSGSLEEYERRLEAARGPRGPVPGGPETASAGAPPTTRPLKLGEGVDRPTDGAPTARPVAANVNPASHKDAVGYTPSGPLGGTAAAKTPGERAGSR